VTGSFTTSLTGGALDGLNNVDISGTITSYSFSAENVLATSTNGYATQHQDFFITTDGGGNITGWNILLSQDNNNFISTNSQEDWVSTCIPYSSLGYCIGESASVSGAPGTWSAVPEPAAWAMMLLGFGGIGFMLRGRRVREGLRTARG
jgi:hypothetical protein